MKRHFLIGFMVCFFFVSCTVLLEKENEPVPDAIAKDPMNATFKIDNRKISLIDGRCELPSAPDSATKIITSVFEKPVYGNIDGKGGPDAAMILAHDPGGSGTFYYAVAALNSDGGYKGLRAILIGDRINFKNIKIHNGLITVNYADRNSGEPMTTPPSVDRLKHLIVAKGSLKEVSPPAGENKIFHGWVTIGHEVRSFIPCSSEKELWFQGNSPALNEIKAAYQKSVPKPFPYAPVFMILAGKKAERVLDGFGLDYDASFFATQLVQVFEKGNCKSNLIWVDSPIAGVGVSSPLIIKGYARGKWFFEGDFPVFLESAKGEILTRGYATAKSAWMTERFVPFESVIEFKAQNSGSRGTLILQKDNPTGRPEFDDELKIPIFFN